MGFFVRARTQTLYGSDRSPPSILTQFGQKGQNESHKRWSLDGMQKWDANFAGMTKLLYLLTCLAVNLKQAGHVEAMISLAVPNQNAGFPILKTLFGTKGAHIPVTRIRGGSSLDDLDDLDDLSSALVPVPDGEEDHHDFADSLNSAGHETHTVGTSLSSASSMRPILCIMPPFSVDDIVFLRSSRVQVNSNPRMRSLRTRTQVSHFSALALCVQHLAMTERLSAFLLNTTLYGGEKNHSKLLPWEEAPGICLRPRSAMPGAGRAPLSTYACATRYPTLNQSTRRAEHHEQDSARHPTADGGGAGLGGGRQGKIPRKHAAMPCCSDARHTAPRLSFSAAQTWSSKTRARTAEVRALSEG